MADAVVSFGAKDNGFTKLINGMDQRLQKFKSGIGNFSKSIGGMAKSFIKVAGPVALLGGAFLGVRSVFRSFTAAINEGGAMNDLATQTGAAAGDLLILKRAFENSGASGDAMGQTIGKLRKAIGEAGQGLKTYKDAFAKLGLSYESLKDLDVKQQFAAVAGALNKVENQTDKATIAQQLFGRSGMSLIPLLRANTTEMERAAKQLGSMPDLINKFNGPLDTVADNLGALAKKQAEFATGLLSEFSPSLAKITTDLANIDVAGFGSAISKILFNFTKAAAEAFKFQDAIDAVKAAINGFKQGQYMESFKLLFNTASIQGQNFINVIYKKGVAALQTLGGFLREIFRGDGATMEFIWQSVNIVLSKIKQGLLTALSEATEGIYWLKGLSINAKRGAEEAGEYVEAALMGISGKADAAGKHLAEAGAAMAGEYAKHESKLGGIFDLTAETQRQLKNIEKISSVTDRAAASAEKEALARKRTTMAAKEAAEAMRNTKFAPSFMKQIELVTNMKSALAKVFPGLESASEVKGEGIKKWLEGVKNPPAPGAAPAAAPAGGGASVEAFKMPTLSGELGAATKAVNERIDQQNLIMSQQGFDVMGQTNSEMRGFQSLARSNQRSFERTMNRAAKYRARGLEGSAANLERRAKAQLLKKSKALLPPELVEPDGSIKPGGAAGPKETAQQVDPIGAAVEKIVALMKKLEEKLPQPALI